MTFSPVFRKNWRYLLCSALVFSISERPVSAAEDAPVIMMGEAAQKNAALAIAVATSGTLGKSLNAMGTVMAEAGHVVSIHPAGSGKVLSVAVVPGQHVRKGETLLTYQNHSLHLVRLEMTRARAGLMTAQAASQNAASAYRRGRELEGTTVPAGETKRRQAAFQAAKDDVVARQADVDTLKHQLEEEYNSVTESDKAQTSPLDETSAIIAPATAEVQAVSVGVADDISPTTELLRLTDMSSVWIASDILPQDAAQVVKGGDQTTELASDTGATQLVSKVTSVSDLADPATGLVRVISQAPNSNGSLRPGMFLTTHLPMREKTTGIIVPESAVTEINGVSTVFVPIGPNQFRPRDVHVGAASMGQLAITAGLSAGEKVVTHGAFALKAVMLTSDTDGGG